MFHQPFLFCIYNTSGMCTFVEKRGIFESFKTLELLSTRHCYGMNFFKKVRFLHTIFNLLTYIHVNWVQYIPTLHTLKKKIVCASIPAFKGIMVVQEERER